MPHDRSDGGGGHDHPHDHEHGHDHGRLGWLRELLPFGHGHSHGEARVDAALETSERGIWALKVSLLGLGATALFQVVIVLISGSVALLAETILRETGMRAGEVLSLRLGDVTLDPGREALRVREPKNEGSARSCWGQRQRRALYEACEP